jgi:hypothetical protein
VRAGIVTPSASAILRLIIRVNRVGCSIGRSAGFRVSAPPAGEKPLSTPRTGTGGCGAPSGQPALSALQTRHGNRLFMKRCGPCQRSLAPLTDAWSTGDLLDAALALHPPDYAGSAVAVSGCSCEDDVGGERGKLRRKFLDGGGITAGPTSRSAGRVRRSNRRLAAPARTPRGGQSIPDRPRAGHSARRCAASGRPAARAPRAA